MNIAVIGLGLIGGSFCKAVKTFTDHKCFGYDTNCFTLENALMDGVIDCCITDFSIADITIICLYPEATVEFLQKNANRFKKGSIVIDTCGVKKYIINNIKDEMLMNDVEFIGAHPMAGREFSGYQNSKAELFNNASLILTPINDISTNTMKILEKLSVALKFSKIVVTTAENHDEIIAYTSQLPHIVSSCYIKSPTLSKRIGFSAGSFNDLSRVARLNEDMWSSLFLKNKDCLIFEVSEIIDNLNKYKSALIEEDSNKLKNLLREGRILKEENDKKM